MARDLLRFLTALAVLGAFVAGIALLGGFREGTAGWGWLFISAAGLFGLFWLADWLLELWTGKGVAPPDRKEQV